MYEVLKNLMAFFIAESNSLFGSFADKMPAKNWRRRVTDIRVPIWDINNSQINRDIYIRHSVVGHGSEEAIVNRLLHKIKSFGFPLDYNWKYQIGLARTANIHLWMQIKLCMRNFKKISIWAGMRCIELNLHLKILSQLSIRTWSKIQLIHKIIYVHVQNRKQLRLVVFRERTLRDILQFKSIQRYEICDL